MCRRNMRDEKRLSIDSTRQFCQVLLLDARSCSREALDRHKGVHLWDSTASGRSGLMDVLCKTLRCESLSQ